MNGEDREMAWRCWNKEVLPFVAMVASETLNVGLNIVFKAATTQGISHYVYVTYSFAISTLVLLPLTFMFPSPSTVELPSSKLPLISRICLLGLTGSVAMLLAYKGIEYSSPTLASAMSNLLPAFTFILAAVLRMEKMAIGSFTTHAKVIGTILSISGALIVVLYKGPTLVQMPLRPFQSHWIVGGLLLAIEYFLFSICNILQAQIVEIYPAKLTVAFYYNLCATIITVPISLIAESDISAWRLGSEVAVIAVLYSGFTGTCLFTVIQLWCMQSKGPFYVASFKPISIAIAAFMSFIFLGDILHLGSVIGAIIISAGFYAVIWGKAKEEEEAETVDSYSFSASPLSSDSKTPLL